MGYNKTKVCFLGGVGRIGGNKILIEYERTKIFLDFGKDFLIWRTYYEFPFTYPKSIEELISIGAIPNIRGLYINDEKAEIDAVFISHAHLDHIGHISVLHRDIPVYMGEGSKVILEAINDVSRPSSKDVERNFSGIRIETFRTGKEIVIKDIAIKPIHVDHSIPAAYGFIVYTPSATIAYTGDFRYHGQMKNLTEDFMKALESEDVDLLITEGTHANFSESLFEYNVEKILSTILENFKGLIIAYFGRTDYDRFRTFYSIANALNREFVIDAKRAYIMQKMQKLVYDFRRVNLDKTLILEPKNVKRLPPKLREFVQDRERKDRIISKEEIMKEPERYIMTVYYGGAGEFIDLSPPKGSIYVLSSSEPVSEEQEISFEKLLNWLERLGIAVYHIHSSGHAMPLDIKRLVLRANPKIAAPIHTERPLFLKNFINEVKWYIPKAHGDYIEV